MASFGTDSGMHKLVRQTGDDLVHIGAVTANDRLAPFIGRGRAIPEFAPVRGLLFAVRGKAEIEPDLLR